jgi:hypothetical protein
MFFAFARVIFMRMRLINERSIGGQFESSVTSAVDNSASSEEYEDAGPRVGRSNKGNVG